jgi:hypothetical protein
MKQNKLSRYFKFTIVLTLGILLIVGVFNWFINPYCMYNSPVIKGLNMSKPELPTHTRLFKAREVERVKPAAICLGTSHAGVGIDPLHPGWSYSPVYNLALPGATLYEMTRYFQHANNTGQLKQVVLTLDFFSFASPVLTAPDFNEDIFHVPYDGHNHSIFDIKDKLIPLLSIDVLVSSIKTVTHQAEQDIKYSQDGWFIETLIYNESEKYGDAFMSQNEFYTSYYMASDYPPWDLHSDNAPLGYYRTILKTCYRDGIKLSIVLSPSHVHEYEILADTGLWTRWEEWKTALVTINEEEAKLAGKLPFAFWDFATYNEFTTESVPVVGDNQTVMQWYWNTDHYKKALGDLLLDRIFGRTDLTEIPLDNFGTLLTSANIDEHLNKIRSDRELYKNKHQTDIAGIEKLIEERMKK